MKKKILKFFSKVFARPLVQVGFYFVGIILIFLISGVFDDFKTSLAKIVGLLSAQETISVFFAGLLSLGIARFLKRCDYYLEESMKIDDDHHKIIRKYNGHANQKESDENIFDKTGMFMSISHTGYIRKSELKNREKDKFSKSYWINEKALLQFRQKKLYTPSVNVFANVQGNTKLVFSDSDQHHNLPSFVIEHADELLMAHKNSNTRNNDTIRLSDFDYEGDTLTLNTQRSTYYHMLITNRCMDFRFANGLTLRNLYEYDNRICPLHKSKFGNQIGINGLILTKDGYVLLEKRDHKKTTWKNKFAQSISLALKENEVILNQDGVIGNTYEDAQAVLKRIIQKTVRKNFGLTEQDCREFVLEKNFLGLARDLLEGGKPNLYFFVETVYTAKELADKITKTAEYAKTVLDVEKATKQWKKMHAADEMITETESFTDKVKEAEDRIAKGDVISADKLASDYYLVKFSDIAINYHYVLNLDRRKAIKIARKVYPRVTIGQHLWEAFKYCMVRTFTPKLQRECGEALLVTISYLELCKDRIDALKSEEGEENCDE